MKITQKIPLTQVILSIIFFLALALIGFFFVQSGDLRLVNSQIYYLYEESLLLKQNLELLPVRNSTYADLTRQLTAHQLLIDKEFFNLQNSLGDYGEIFPELKEAYENSFEEWRIFFNGTANDPKTSFSQLNVELYNLATSPLSAKVQDSGILTALQVADKNLYADEVKMMEDLLKLNTVLIERMEDHLIPSLNDFSLLTSDKVEGLLQIMRRVSILLALLTFGVGIIIGLILARNISRNLVILDKSIGQVASGDLDFTIKTIGNDEFQQIGENFNHLTNTLWFRLDSLKDLMRDLGSSVEDDTDQKTLLDTVLELSIDSTGAESGIILLYNEENNHLQVEAMMGDFPPPVKIPASVMMNESYVQEWFMRYPMKMGETLIGEAAQRKTHFFVRDNLQQKLFPENLKPESSLFISSAIVLPLMNEDSILGVMVLGKNSLRQYFTELDYTFMKSYARFVTITLDNFRKYQEVVHKHELNREIGVAAEIQKTLLPGRMPPMKTLRIAAYSDAAKGVSGDYYDVFPLNKNKMAIIICDVSGKGIPASLFMVMIRTVIRTVSSPSMNAAQILEKVNQQITGNFRTGTFATISLLVVDQKKYEISYANGAHHPLYLYRARSKKFLMFDADGLPLGIDIHASFGHKRIKIEKNDYLLLFTDGLPEARNALGEELSTNRLLKQALKYKDKNPGMLKDGVRDYLKRFCKGTKQHDDETFVAIKVV